MWAKRGCYPLDSEDASPANANPFRLRYANSRLANLPEMVKPDTCEEEMCKCTHKDDRSGWGGRASKEQKGNPGKSIRRCLRGQLDHKGCGGINNAGAVDMDDGTARSSGEVG